MPLIKVTNRCFVRTKFNLSQSVQAKNVAGIYLDKNSEVINCIKKNLPTEFAI